ncbi:MAG TPA: hypothetical protein VFE61_30270 [Candidatus Sulfotelmatobacter sp.]|nr:hypothetical protein [Candidatus Sulfotelmatobacter sp.]
MWIWLERHLLQISTLFAIAKHECIRQQLQQALASRYILISFSLQFRKPGGITYQALETSLSLALLVLREGFSIHRN